MVQQNRPPEISEIWYRLSDDREVRVGPWKLLVPLPVTDAQPVARPRVSAQTSPPVQRYGEPLERMARDYLTPSPASSSPPASEPVVVSEPPRPSPLEQAVSGLAQAKESLIEVHRGLSSITTIGTYTTAGLVAGIGFGALAYNLMVNPRSVSASILVGGLCTLTGVAIGWYKAHHA